MDEQAKFCYQDEKFECSQKDLCSIKNEIVELKNRINEDNRSSIISGLKSILNILDGMSCKKLNKRIQQVYQSLLICKNSVLASTLYDYNKVALEQLISELEKFCKNNN